MLEPKSFKCRQCGKVCSSTLLDSRNYVFKIEGKYFCSWSCLRAYEKLHTTKKIMHWVKAEKNTWVATGCNGTFIIQQKNYSLFLLRYNYKEGHVLALPPQTKLKTAKEFCEKNYYWEKN